MHIAGGERCQNTPCKGNAPLLDFNTPWPAFPGKMDQAPSLRHECLAALLGHAHSPGLGCCPTRDWEQCILLLLTQLYQAGEQRLRAPGESLHFQSSRYAGLSSSTELEMGCLKPLGKLHALLTPLCPGARAWGEAWFALDSAGAASWHVPAVPAQPTEHPWSWKTAPELCVAHSAVTY